MSDILEQLESSMRVDFAGPANGPGCSTWGIMDTAIKEIRKLRRENEKLTGILAVHISDRDGICVFCNKTTDSWSGNPGLWPVFLCHPDGTGIVKLHHNECVMERLFPDKHELTVNELAGVKEQRRVLERKLDLLEWALHDNKCWLDIVSVQGRIEYVASYQPRHGGSPKVVPGSQDTDSYHCLYKAREWMEHRWDNEVE